MKKTLRNYRKMQNLNWRNEGNVKNLQKNAKSEFGKR